jgi:secreted Zn-dependent insulinase-like peptidase
VKQGLVTSISAGSFPKMGQSFDLMEVDIGLTAQGEKDYMKVIDSVYQFINEIKDEGIKDFVFDELKYKNLMDFNNAPK